MSEILRKAQEMQERLLEQISGSESIQSQRPAFHFAVPGGWCNDPNGFSQFNGKVHLFYQFHPYSTKWGPMHWGHVTTEDFLNWKTEPVALAPDSEADIKGCFSGTAFDDNGKHVIAYTGVSSNGKSDVQNQCIAVGDGSSYMKISENPVITASKIPFSYNTGDFRDPKIFKNEDTYYMLCVLKLPEGAGALVMFSSKNLKNWLFHGLLDYSKHGLSGMWECPGLTKVDGRDILIFSPQEMKEDEIMGFHDGNNSVYMSGKLDLENCSFDWDIRAENRYTAAQIDYGIDFYAPQTTLLKDGRTILIGWMQAWESNITPENYIWSGMMTVPRELSFKNNRLYQNPVRELEKWKTDLRQVEIAGGKKLEVFHEEERHFEIDFKMDASKGGRVNLFLGKEGDENVFLTIDLDEQFLQFSREASFTPGAISTRKAYFTMGAESLNVKVLCDTCSLEVFLDDGKLAFTNAFFLKDFRSNLIMENASGGIVSVNFCRLRNPSF